MNDEIDPWFRRLLLVLALPLYIFMNGVALSLYWSWFVVPLGAPEIGLLHAYALLVLVNAYVHGYAPDEKLNEIQFIARLVVTSIARPLFLLLIGHVIRSFV